MVSRNHTLDGIRGCLAVVVMLNHAAHLRGWGSLTWPANGSVVVFFMLSACVLTRSWDGRYLTFLARRALRLWPTYALCLFAGALFFRQAVPLPYYAWCPLAMPTTAPMADVPTWSLTVEAWAMPFMPLFVWVARRRFIWFAAAVVATLAAGGLYPPAFFGIFFFIGAWLSRFPLHWAPLQARLPQWLGRISYPLYLCHWPIIWGLGLPLYVSIPLTFAVAHLLAGTVEAWSIAVSRTIPRRLARWIAGPAPLPVAQS
ncbi:MAG TPA: acyltransferase family protein [Alphaproteobacteria bacterium]|nr:acyltransferase family protein [Alphaproteobacteria bacterium]